MEQKRYRITADRKTAVVNATDNSVTFVIKSNGFKQAWSDARNLTRVGADKLPTETEGQTVDLQAGMFTVRSVFTIDKSTGGRAKAKVISAADFLAAAKAKEIHLPKKLADLAAEMGIVPSEAAPAPAADSQAA